MEQQMLPLYHGFSALLAPGQDAAAILIPQASQAYATSLSCSRPVILIVSAGIWQMNSLLWCAPTLVSVEDITNQFQHNAQPVTTNQSQRNGPLIS